MNYAALNAYNNSPMGLAAVNGRLQSLFGIQYAVRAKREFTLLPDAKDDITVRRAMDAGRQQRRNR